MANTPEIRNALRQELSRKAVNDTELPAFLGLLFHLPDILDGYAALEKENEELRATLIRRSEIR